LIEWFGWFIESVEDVVVLGILVLGVAVGWRFVPRAWRAVGAVTVAITGILLLLGPAPGLPPWLHNVHEVTVVGVIVSTTYVAWKRHLDAMGHARSTDFEHRKLQALLEAGPGFLVVTDTEGVVQEVNAEVLRLLGVRSRADVVGRMWSEVVGRPEDDPLLAQARAWVAADCPGEPVADYGIVDRDGRERWIAWHRRPARDEDGHVAYVVSGGVDITDRHAREETLRARGQEFEALAVERSEDLREALDELQVALEAREVFFAGASHELRNPLTSVIGFSGVLMSGAAGPLSQEQRKQVGMIRAAGETLLRLVNDLLDVSKAERGLLTAEPTDVDVTGIVCAVVADLADAAQMKGLRVVADCPHEAIAARTDGVRLRQIVENLVGNAIKYTDAGSVTVQLDACEGSVIVRVIDTGRGIDAADVPDLFEPFSRFKRAGDSAQTGNGLGLYVSRRLAQVLGGDIEVSTQRGSGSTFTLRIARSIGIAVPAASA